MRGSERVVMTSSCGAIYYGHPPRTAPFDETSWTNVTGDMSAYVRSKALAERAAWDFMAAEGGALGTLDRESDRNLRSGATAGYCPRRDQAGHPLAERHARLSPPLLQDDDVRDVADLRPPAMTHPAARGERFIASSGDIMSMLAIARVLGRKRLGDAAKRVPTRELPNWLVRFPQRFDRTLRPLVPLLDSTRRATSAKAQRVLGWNPRPPEEALVATAESLLTLGAVPGASSMTRATGAAAWSCLTHVTRAISAPQFETPAVGIASRPQGFPRFLRSLMA